ncbi:MAG: VWA domain-containing protein [Candidatus Korobacteraceae bacterium]
MPLQLSFASAFLAIALYAPLATAQRVASPSQPGPANVQHSDENAPELSTQESSTTFKVRVNLVEVRVVVRDAQGHAVGNLKQEDFQLLDNGKPQVISRFSVETAESKPPVVKQETPPETPGATLTLPKRYVAYLFDDIHLQFGDLAQVVAAAKRHLQTLRTTDRAAVFTTSGQNQVEFTDDRARLQTALGQLHSRSVTASGTTECPNVSYYMADQIINKHDEQALRVAAQDALDCGNLPDARSAMTEAQSAARRALDLGNHETQLSLGAVKDVVRRIAVMPGQRSILIVSPGFYNSEQLQEQTELEERALHSYVIISALDARGLYTETPDASNSRMPNHEIAALMVQYQHQEALANGDVLADLAHGTGGTFFTNRNDLETGFQQLATPPEYSYLLAFSPQNLKFDGRFHNVKVTVKAPQKLAVQARKGYYAPKQAVGEAEQAKQQIQDEVFSQEELHDLPVEMHTQFFKTSDEEAKLSVLVRLDVRHLHYRKTDGRNNNNLTIVSALFDRNGNFVTGSQKVLQMRWKDESLNGKLASGVTLKSSFDVKPGSYLVRLVVRDEDGQLAAQNGAIEIP